MSGERCENHSAVNELVFRSVLFGDRIRSRTRSGVRGLCVQYDHAREWERVFGSRGYGCFVLYCFITRSASQHIHSCNHVVDTFLPSSLFHTHRTWLRSVSPLAHSVDRKSTPRHTSTSLSTTGPHFVAHRSGARLHPSHRRRALRRDLTPVPFARDVRSWVCCRSMFPEESLRDAEQRLSDDQRRRCCRLRVRFEVASHEF